MVYIILSIALIIAYFVRSDNKKNYHKAILSIFGIAYLSIWPFIDFYFRINFINDNIKFQVFGIFVAVLVVLVLLPQTQKISGKNSLALVFAFFLLVFSRYLFENDIKYLVAEFSGYFDTKDKVVSGFTNATNHVNYTDNTSGFTIKISEAWAKYKNKLGMEYLVYKNTTDKTIELKPSCFHNVKLTLPDIVSNAIYYEKSLGFKSDKKCFKESNNLYTCLVKTKYISDSNKFSNKLEKWRWFSMDRKQDRNIELDVVFYSMGISYRNDVISIINSIKYNQLPSPLPYCMSTAEWF